MSQENTFEKIKELVTDRFGVEEERVTPEMTFQEDLGADSLDVVELVMELEDNFGIQIADEDIENIVTIDDIVKYIDAHQ
ncbi:acyl carrier protein [Aerococcus kribbianus]|uniref:Acyl carrier protein n=1 Tax=Aerococcus kribbianus TaxID=2999064 RepID=A0A9X3FMB0_9LACT|nr:MULTISPECIES: acyl carrier protein [unclassified Aerococcus]MCZ0717162.1 acyl carrier protein [Aerococcus sp. YH-aer221]MCZ0725450.1 acyl carrier protein [Aerococcus sp. YH-aer222]